MTGDQTSILAVEDDPQILKLIQLVLGKEGYDVGEAATVFHFYAASANKVRDEIGSAKRPARASRCGRAGCLPGVVQKTAVHNSHSKIHLSRHNRLLKQAPEFFPLYNTLACSPDPYRGHEEQIKFPALLQLAR